MGKQIKELTVRGTVEGTDMLPMQGANDLNYYGTVAQIGGYAVKATCDTAGATQQKVVSLTGYTGTAIPSVIAIVFEHANEYGDCTASPATFPQLVIQNDADTPATLATLDVCDSRGHTAGTGCWNDGDRMEFAVEMTTSNTGRAIIKNSDVRQATSTMTIKSDGYIKYHRVANSVNVTCTGSNSYKTGAKITLKKGLRYHVEAFVSSSVSHDVIISQLSRSGVTDLSIINAVRTTALAGGGSSYSYICYVNGDNASITMQVYDGFNATLYTYLSAVSF